MNRKSNAPNSDNMHASGETLDLADLDLSQLRLTKKDLETLSTLTPNLPKHCQDQLLAQLPPNQARKLSRTLSMQATGQQSSSHVYKRSLSSGRDIPMAHDHTHTAGKVDPASPLKENESISLDSPLVFDRKSILRRSLSRGRDTTSDSTGQSSSSVRNSDLSNRLSYTGDLHSRYRSNDFVSAQPSSSTRTDYYSRLPPKVSNDLTTSSEAIDSPIRRRSSSTRRVSRFLRPDFYDSSTNLATNGDDSNYSKVRRERERETQSVLREIRERSRDRARRDSTSCTDSASDRPNSMAATSSEKTDNAVKDARRKSSIPNIRITVDKQNGRVCHARNKSIERCCDLDDATECDKNDHRRCSVSMSRNLSARTNSTASTSNDKRKSEDTNNTSFTDQIISELVQKSQETTARNSSEAKEIVCNGAPKKLKTKVKEGKKFKGKSKSIEDDNKNTIVVVEHVNNLEMVTALTNEIESVTLPFPKSSISKLVRPKSYPSKDEKDAKKEIENVEKSPPTEIVIVESKTKSKLPDPSDVTVEVTLRPKSYPNSKLTPPKETVVKPSKKSSSPPSSASNGSTSSKNAITAAVEKFIEKSAERLSPVKSITNAKAKTGSNGETVATPKLTKKKVKIVKKVKSEQSPPTDEPQTHKMSTDEAKETKSPEKKVKSGFLYSIGQKFEKMRENSKNKERKSSKVPAPSSPAKILQKDSNEISPVPVDTNEILNTEIPVNRIDTKSVTATALNPNKSEQRKSRIDAMIRNLRERSVPHTMQNDASSLSTESALIKRAVSVEDMTNGVPNFNKCNVNKVLGLFRRIEREQQMQQQLPTENADVNKERPKSGGFVSKLKKAGRPYYTGAKSDTIITLTDQLENRHQSEKMNTSTAVTSKIPQPKSTAVPLSTKSTNESENCPECGTNDCKDIKGINEECPVSDSNRFTYNLNRIIEPTARAPREIQNSVAANALSDRERIRNNRKGLILDLNIERFDAPTSLNHNNNLIAASINNNNYPNGNHATMNNNNGESSKHSTMASVNHNNNYNFSNLPSETKIADHSANYSSDSRSLRDDCESTSTFLSPTDEPELYFDDWSVCSSSVDDHSRLSPAPLQEHTKYLPSAHTAHHHQHKLYPKSLTSSSHHVDVTPSTSDTESVIDRIKRRSFYCRFNEKKPKRTSSIVGPSARDYYRDIASTKAKSKSSDAANFRTQSKSPTPMNRTESGTTSPASTLDDFHQYHTPRSSRYDDHRLDRPPRSGDYLSLRSTLTSPPAVKYSSQSKGTSSGLSTSDYLLNGNHRPYSTRNSIYDGLTPSASSSSTTSSTSPFIYGTYSPKRRISTSYLAPSLTNVGSSPLNSNGTEDHHHHHHHLTNNCYATLGHRTKPKAYDQRSISMLDSSSMPSSMYGTRRLTSATNGGDHQFAHLRSDYGNFNSR